MGRVLSACGVVWYFVWIKMPAFRGGRHLLRESRGEGRRKPATPPLPRVDVDSPRLDPATVFLGALSFLDTKQQKKLVPRGPEYSGPLALAVLHPYSRLRGPRGRKADRYAPAFPKWTVSSA